MIILGINAFHPDSSACLLIDGKVKIALEEERINRIKHWSGLPILAIKNCLENQKVKIGDIDLVAINANFFSNFFNKLKFILFSNPNLNFLFNKLKDKNKKINILELISSEFHSEKFNKKCKLISVEHHLSHLASAFFDSPFEKCVNLSVDGFGDFASTSWGLGVGNQLKIDGRILFPHSLGIFYEAFTQYLGFNHYGDEYKIMGLSSYGKPTETKKIERIIYKNKGINFNLNLDYFNHHKKNISFKWNNSQPIQGALFSKKIINLFGKFKNLNKQITEEHKNIASSVQHVYEDILFELLNKIYQKYKIPYLTLSGGCAQNSLANGRILANTKFENLFIPSNPGDAGGAVGAAFVAWSRIKKSRPITNKNPYLGLEFTNTYIEKLINDKKKIIENKNFNFLFLKDEDLFNYVANALSQSKIIGWFQGKMEWGPRALGNRSILADPRKLNIKEIINLKIKKRELFRPFAPSILAEDAKNWFKDYIDEEPFMSRVLNFKNDKVNLVPAVVHTDGSGRVHTVKKNINPRYYKLIKQFKKITEVPILLNTSFNENEPIVLKPEEAFDCFERTNMDMLVLENWIIIRN